MRSSLSPGSLGRNNIYVSLHRLNTLATVCAHCTVPLASSKLVDVTRRSHKSDNFLLAVNLTDFLENVFCYLSCRWAQWTNQRLRVHKPDLEKYVVSSVKSWTEGRHPTSRRATFCCSSRLKWAHVLFIFADVQYFWNRFKKLLLGRNLCQSRCLHIHKYHQRTHCREDETGALHEEQCVVWDLALSKFKLWKHVRVILSIA